MRTYLTPIAMLLLAMFTATGCSTFEPRAQAAPPPQIRMARWKIDESKVKNFDDVKRLIKFFDLTVDYPAGDPGWEARIDPVKKFLKPIQ